jgi:hypothetical protein
LDSVLVPLASAEPSKTFLYLRDSKTFPLPGAFVEECFRADVDCKNPLPGASATTGADGVVTLPIERYFNGQPLVYFRATGPGFPLHLFYPPLFWLNYSTSIAFPVFKDTEVPGDPPARGHGTIGFAVRSCGAPRTEAGVAVTVNRSDAMTQTLYSAGGTLAATGATDVYGLGAITNVPVGSVTIESVRVETGVRIGSATVHVSDGAVTIAVVTPTPPP